jgi:hypothetical protein
MASHLTKVLFFLEAKVLYRIICPRIITTHIYCTRILGVERGVALGERGRLALLP